MPGAGLRRARIRPVHRQEPVDGDFLRAGDGINNLADGHGGRGCPARRFSQGEQEARRPKRCYWAQPAQQFRPAEPPENKPQRQGGQQKAPKNQRHGAPAENRITDLLAQQGPEGGRKGEG